ncbi:hypothetical protein PHLCEN_2v12434 [Hermanssonia centrifuga]|uniref:Retroviral polymerase SH3-like domain-containing protein n=1 Tax=Hermanssonia centrifuga TaxID=98765 RepID=A0A2R6NH66_9APHY|nr:hypothetical protein PHLCEN_2v12434 [Hermanssonia centrifuga]
MDYARRVKKVLTIDELHCLMGHISHNAAQDLVKKGLVLGVVIENSPYTDPRALEGQWVGFDEQSKAYQIYWPSRQSVTVEKSVCFTNNDPGVVAVLLKGECVLKEPIKLNSTGTAPNTSNQPEINPDSARNLPAPADVLGQGFEEIPPAGRGKRVKKPFDYHLREGKGSVDGRGSVENLPKAMPSVADKGAALVEEVEIAVEE